MLKKIRQNLSSGTKGSKNTAKKFEAAHFVVK